jgi:HAE1 family hydrophobic/amphiphilic exporter-1
VKQELLPNLSFPIVTITTVYPGANAEAVDRTVTAPIENALSGLQGIESTQSTSSEGFAFTIVQFDVNADIKAAKSDVADKLGSVSFPTGVQTPKVGTFDFNSLPAINTSVSSKDPNISLADLQTRVQSELIPNLSSIDGVSRVNLTGGEQQQVLINLDPDKMAQNKVTQTQVVQILQANNLAFPVGTLDENGRSLPLRVTHAFSTTTEIENLILGIKGGLPTGATGATGAAGATTPGTTGAAATGQVQIPDALLLHVKDIATVQVAKTGNVTITRTNGNPSLGLQVYIDPNANIISVTQAVKDELNRAANAQSATPLAFKIVTEQAATIQKSISGVVQEGLTGAVIAVVVIFIFLLSLRTTLIAAVSIPVSVIVALILMRLQGFSLNVITLGGLAVAIGRVVDDSIVVLENIYRHVREGDEVNSSVIQGTREVAGAITTSTLTTVAVFLPLGLAGGYVSKLFLPFSLTVTYALLASLLVALTVVPLLARLFMGRLAKGNKIAQAGKSAEEENSWLQRVYTPILKWSLKHRWITLLIAGIVFFGSLGLGSQLKFTFLPDSPQKNISISLSTPPGTDLQATTAKAVQVENLIKPLQSQGKVSDIQTTIGQGSGTAAALAQLTGSRAGGVPNTAALTVSLTDQAGDAQALADNLEAQINAIGGFQSVTVQTVAASQSGGGGQSSGLDIEVVGNNPESLRQANKTILDYLSGDKARQLNIANVTSNLADVKPALQVDVNPQLALVHGTTAAQVAQQIGGLLNGANAGTITLSSSSDPTAVNKPLTMFVQVDPTKLNLERLKNLPVGTINPVPLEQVATIQEVPGAVSITRINGDQAASITGKITSKDTINVQRQVEQEVKKLSLPAGVTVGTGTQAQSQADALQSLGVALLVAIGLVYLVMLIWSGSLLNPLVILFSLPLAAIGAILGLFITGKPIGITSLIGMLMLIGIVVTNAIVLLDLVEQYRRSGRTVYDSVLHAGRVRVRPILMTAIATIVALIPLALSSGNESFLTSDLAIVVMGGLFTSTMLTLLVVPVVYSLVSGLRNRLSRKPKSPQIPPAEPMPSEETPVEVAG